MVFIPYISSQGPSRNRSLPAWLWTYVSSSFVFARSSSEWFFTVLKNIMPVAISCYTVGHLTYPPNVRRTVIHSRPSLLLPSRHDSDCGLFLSVYSKVMTIEIIMLFCQTQLCYENLFTEDSGQALINDFKTTFGWGFYIVDLVVRLKFYNCLWCHDIEISPKNILCCNYNKEI